MRFAEAASEQAESAALHASALVISGDIAALLDDPEQANLSYDRALELSPTVEARRAVENRRMRLGSVERAGARIAWYEQGSSGPTLLLVRPLGYGFASFQPLVQLLCDRYRTVAVIQRGGGASDPLPPSGRYPYQDQLDDLAAVIEALGRGPVIGVGLSRGATQLVSLAAQRPDLIERLVLVGAAPDWTPHEAGEDALGGWDAGFLARLDTDFAGAMRDIARSVFTEPDADELVEQHFQSLAATPVEVMRHFMRDVPRGDAADICRAVRCPVLLAHGSGDVMVSREEVCQMLNLLPRSRLHV